MKYRKLGRTNFEVSDIGYGLWGMSGWSGSDDEESLKAMQLAADLGCNFFDTAWAYGDGKSDGFLGEIMERNKGKRLYAASKIPPKNLKWPASAKDKYGDVFPADHVFKYADLIREKLRVDSIDALQREPIAPAGGNTPQLLTNLASFERGTTTTVANHYNVQPVYDVFASVQDRDLGGAARDIKTILSDVEKHLPRGTSLIMRGQVESMNSAFTGLATGLIFAIVLVYALMVINFQSWLDPFIIITALPGALAGILWALFLTQTTINVPSLMGAIMSIGVATANSILLVTFANDQRRSGSDAMEAALLAGYTRLRPVLMTALAMVIGMFPMALGLGEGGEQNAPLARAVIGGLTVATFATLFVVPVIYSLLRRKPPFAVAKFESDVTEPGAPSVADHS